MVRVFTITIEALYLPYNYPSFCNDVGASDSPTPYMPDDVKLKK